MVSTRCVVVSAGGSTVSARRRRYLSWRTHPASRVLALGASVGASRVRVESKQRSTSSALQRASRRARGRGRTLVEAVHGTLTVCVRRGRSASRASRSKWGGRKESDANRTRRLPLAQATWRRAEARCMRVYPVASRAESGRTSGSGWKEGMRYRERAAATQV